MADQDIRSGDPSIEAVFGVLWRRRGLLIASVAAFTLLAILLSLVMPRTYIARCTLLPPTEANNQTFIGLPGASGALGFLGLQSDTGNSARLFKQILQSRTVAEAVVRQVGALDWLKQRDRSERAAMEAAVAMVQRRSRFNLMDAGMLEITAKGFTGWFAGRASDEIARQRAADLVNAYVAQLDQVNREKSLSRAKQIRIYLERQFEINEETVRRLGEELTSFREEHGALALDAQTKALVETAAMLKGQLLEKEIELGIALQTMTEENPVVRALRSTIEQQRRRLSELERTSSGDASAADTQIDLPASRIPSLELRLAGYERELTAQLQLQTYIREQYYQAKIEEARDTPTIQVLDPAVPPEERDSPKRKMMVLGAAFAGVLFGIAAAGVLEWFERRRAAWFPRPPAARA